MSCKCISDIFILFHLFLWDSFPAMLAISPVYRIQLWITKDNNVSEKSRVTRKNGLCSQLNAADK